MGSRYTAQSASSYNSSPPPDDGSQVSANKITWAGIKTKLADSVKGLADAINTAVLNWSDFSSVTTTTNLSTDASHHMKTIEVTSGNPTISLGDAATMTNNYVVTVTNIQTSSTLAPTVNVASAGNTLDGTVNGSFVFPLNGPSSFTFKVNNAANGYYSEAAGGAKGGLNLVYSMAKNFAGQAIQTVVGATAANTAAFIVCNNAGTVTLTLTGTYEGQILYVKNYLNQLAISASSNVVPITGGAAGTAILAATSGKWAMLRYNSATLNWEIMASN